jgi:hypothetical protein
LVQGIISSGTKQSGHEFVHSPPSRAEVKKSGAIPLLPHTSSWNGAYLIKHRAYFTLHLYMYRRWKSKEFLKESPPLFQEEEVVRGKRIINIDRVVNRM